MNSEYVLDYVFRNKHHSLKIADKRKMTASMLLPDVLIPDSGLYSPAILIPAFICLSAALPSLSPHRNAETGSVLTSYWSLTSCPGF